MFATLQACRPLGIGVVALHVHHGLSPNADAWLAHCAAQCAAWAAEGHGVAFEAARLEGGHAAGESVEAWARHGRYRALAAMALARGARLVLLGHHQRDQAETFLLQALRGGGAAGLAAMPASAERDGITWARPWLSLADGAIERYARDHGLRWIEDESNADTRLARNRLRHDVWPALVAAFPEAAASLAASARRAHEAAASSASVAAADLADIAGAGGLRLDAWHMLPPPRRIGALRAWLHAVRGRPAPAALVERLATELLPVGQRRWPLADGTLHSHRGLLAWVEGNAVLTEGPVVMLDARRPGRYPVPAWRGELVVAACEQGGIAAAAAAALELTPRRPGDRFQPQADRPARSLKLQYQAAGIAGFARAGPLVRCEGRVVFVPGLGLDVRALARPGEPQLLLAWQRAGEPADSSRQPGAAG